MSCPYFVNVTKTISELYQIITASHTLVSNSNFKNFQQDIPISVLLKFINHNFIKFKHITSYFHLKIATCDFLNDKTIEARLLVGCDLKGQGCWFILLS